MAQKAHCVNGVWPWHTAESSEDLSCKGVPLDREESDLAEKVLAMLNDGSSQDHEDEPSLSSSSPSPHRDASPSLSAHAPEFVPHKPHTVTVFHPADMSTTSMGCNLALSTLGDLHRFIQEQHQLLPHAYDLHHGGQVLAGEAKDKLIDIGVGNGAVVALQLKTLPLLPQQYYMLQALGQLQMAAMGMPVNGGPPGPLQALHHAPHTARPSAPPSPPRLPQQTLPQPHTPVHLPRPLPPQQPTPPQHPAHLSTPVLHPSTPPSLPSHPSPASKQSPFNVDHIVSTFSTDAFTAEGARTIVGALTRGGSAAFNSIFRAAVTHLSEMALHQNANRVVHALINMAEVSQLGELLDWVTRDVVLLTEGYGSDILINLLNVVASNVEHFPEGKYTQVIQAIASDIRVFATRVGGRKVIVVLLQLFKRHAEPILEAAEEKLLLLARDQCGCITVQRMYDHADKEHKGRFQRAMRENLTQLITNPYGNYVVQHLVKDSYACSVAVAQHLCSRIVPFSTNKFASNVIESCLQVGPDTVRQLLICEICKHLPSLMKDGFGNYVVQSAVEHAPSTMIEGLRDAIIPLIADCQYGTHIKGKLQKRLKAVGLSDRLMGSPTTQPGSPSSQMQGSPMTPPLCSIGNTQPSSTPTHAALPFFNLHTASLMSPPLFAQPQGVATSQP